MKGLATLLVLVNAGCGATPSSMRTVVFDESRDALFSIHDPGFMGYSAAAAALRSAGYSVWANVTPLSGRLPKLRPARDYMIVLGLRRNGWSVDDVAATREFLREGGVVLLLVEHDNAYGSADAANALTRQLGVEVLPGAAAGSLEATLSVGTVTVARAPRLELDSVLLYYAAPLTSHAGAATALARGRDGTPVAMTAAWGSGRVAVVGDAEFLWNGGPAFGLGAGDNRRFLVGLVALLAGGRGNGLPSPASATMNSTDAQIVAWDDSADPRMGETPDGYWGFINELKHRGYSVVTTSSPQVLRGAKVIFIAEPTRPLPISLRDDQHLLVVLTAASSVTTPLGGAPFVRSLARYASNSPLPLMATLQQRGITLEAAGLRAPNGDVDLAAVPDAASQRCSWKRVAALHADAQATILKESVGYADASLLTPMNGFGMSLERRPVTGLVTWPLLVRTPRTLVFASGSSLQNDARGSQCFTDLVHIVLAWLRPVPAESTLVHDRQRN